MNVELLGTRLKAELARNKAKSAVLGIMFLVATYFWIPLLGDLFGGDSSGEADIATPATRAQADIPASVEVTKSTKGEAKPLDWRTAVARLREDPLRGPIETFSLSRDPFANLSIPLATQPPELEEETEEQKTEHDVQQPPEPMPPTFEELGLVLNGIMVGINSRVATINGTNYREGQTVTVFADNSSRADSLPPQTTEVKAEVNSIHSNFVVVRYDGRPHKLVLKPLMMSQNRNVGISRP